MRGVFAIDLRTLALLRAALGLLILADLINRAPDLTAFYSDYGVWPRPAAMAFSSPWRWSLYFLSGEPAMIALLFAVQGVVALFLILGYRSRLMTFLSWLLLGSLANRNLVIQQGGDQLLGLLLFWAMFLPLGARWSVDAALRPESAPLGEARHFSPATIAILVQAASVYFFGALLKDSPIWMPRGEAVYYALHLDSFATPIAVYFRAFPMLLQGLTYFVWTLELIMPVLMFSPLFHLPLRVLGLSLLIAMHLGFAAFLHIGLFPAISIASLLLFLPTEVWDRLEARVFPPHKRAITLFYDRGCGVCAKICRLLRAFALTRDNAIRPAQDDPAAAALLARHDSWVVRAGDDRQRVKWEALVFVLKQSPLTWGLGALAGILAPGPLVVRPKRINPSVWEKWTTQLVNLWRDFSNRWEPSVGIAPLVVRPKRINPSVWEKGTTQLVNLWRDFSNRWEPSVGIAPLGARLYDWIGRQRPAMGRLAARWLPERTPYQGPGRWEGALVTGLFLFVLAWNASTLPKVGYRMPGMARNFAIALRLDQSWRLFAPHPYRQDGWFIIRGEFTDASPIDLWTGRVGEPPRDKPEPPYGWFGDYRWRKYFERIVQKDYRGALHELGRSYCLTYNRYRPARLPLARLEIMYMRQTTPPPGESAMPPEAIRLLSWNCLAHS
ncbi:MAG: HTTM domain-containing protein [Pseudomonadota bacterium]